MKEVTAYITTDDEIFLDKEKALFHQNILDNKISYDETTVVSMRQMPNTHLSILLLHFDGYMEKCTYGDQKFIKAVEYLTQTKFVYQHIVTE
jgi:hypothetical protein